VAAAEARAHPGFIGVPFLSGLTFELAWRRGRVGRYAFGYRRREVLLVIDA